MIGRQLAVVITLILTIATIILTSLITDAVQRGSRARAVEQLNCIKAAGEMVDALTVMACKDQIQGAPQ